jgi:hypothetical protein
MRELLNIIDGSQYFIYQFLLIINYLYYIPNIFDFIGNKYNENNYLSKGHFLCDIISQRHKEIVQSHNKVITRNDKIE